MPRALARTLVLTEKTADGTVQQAFDVSAKLDPAFVPPAAMPQAPRPASSCRWCRRCSFALLGGLILNLMPCVFPVLSMKAAALARAGGETRGARARRAGLPAGVLVDLPGPGRGRCCACARGGEALGWGFQLQSPRSSRRWPACFFAGRPEPVGRVRGRQPRSPGVGAGLAGAAAATPAPSSPACWRGRRRALHRAVHGRGARAMR